MKVVYDAKLSLLIMRAHTIALPFKIVEKGDECRNKRCSPGHSFLLRSVHFTAVVFAAVGL